VGTICAEEASYYTNYLAYALNSYDVHQLYNLLSRVCCSDIKVVKNVYSYITGYSSSELIGLNSFVDYWSFIQEMIPDGSVSVADARACDSDKAGHSVYISFLQFKGTVLSSEFDFLACPLIPNLAKMSGWSINYTKGFKKMLLKGSFVVHVNSAGLISSIELFLHQA
jgi:hypothetical protein